MLIKFSIKHAGCSDSNMAPVWRSRGQEEREVRARLLERLRFQVTSQEIMTNSFLNQGLLELKLHLRMSSGKYVKHIECRNKNWKPKKQCGSNSHNVRHDG